eukprot:Pgem_evm1s5499
MKLSQRIPKNSGVLLMITKTILLLSSIFSYTVHPTSALFPLTKTHNNEPKKPCNETSCNQQYLKDRFCTPECYNIHCNWDEGDCASDDKNEECSNGCKHTDVGNGICDNACNTVRCFFDAQDCDPCSEGCPPEFVGDGRCHEACNNKWCNYDRGDCVAPGPGPSSPVNSSKKEPPKVIVIEGDVTNSKNNKTNKVTDKKVLGNGERNNDNNDNGNGVNIASNDSSDNSNSSKGSSNSNSNDNINKTKRGEIVGIVLGSISSLALIIGVLVFYCTRRNKSKKRDEREIFNGMTREEFIREGVTNNVTLVNDDDYHMANFRYKSKELNTRARMNVIS